MKLKAIFIASLMTIGFAMTANAGVVPDADSDGVPDVFDNCVDYPNGPAQAPNNQVDFDNDGFGNRCDADYDQSGGTVGAVDFNLFLGNFGNPATSQFDNNADGSTNAPDFNIFLELFGGPAGG
jgi:hypothetical protein